MADQWRARDPALGDADLPGSLSTSAPIAAAGSTRCWRSIKRSTIHAFEPAAASIAALEAKRLPANVILAQARARRADRATRAAQVRPRTASSIRLSPQPVGRSSDRRPHDVGDGRGHHARRLLRRSRDPRHRLPQDRTPRVTTSRCWRAAPASSPPGRSARPSSNMAAPTSTRATSSRTSSRSSRTSATTFTSSGPTGLMPMARYDPRLEKLHLPELARRPPRLSNPCPRGVGMGLISTTRSRRRPGG